MTKKMTSVFKLGYPNLFAEKIVKTFDLNKISGYHRLLNERSDCGTLCEGIFIDGKLHGTAKILIFNYDGMQFCLVGNFSKGELHGSCAFITRKSKKWSRLSFENGVRSGDEI